MHILAIDIGASSIKAGIISESNGIFRNVSAIEKVTLETNDFLELKKRLFTFVQKNDR